MMLLSARSGAAFAAAAPGVASLRQAVAPQRIVPFVGSSILAGRNRNARAALVVVAADKKGGLDSGEQRAKLAKAARLANRTRRSAVNTRIKKVIKLAEEYKAKIEVIGSEQDVQPLEQLISEAYKEIDKAVNKNILHKNNAARKKARIARYKRAVLIQAGLYVPLPSEPASSA